YGAGMSHAAGAGPGRQRHDHGAGMKDLWQKLTIDWPCALGDWLWAALVVAPARVIDGLTRRRVLHILGFILLLIFFQQVVMFDLTFLFGLDLGLMMEVAAAVFVLTARNQ